MAGGRRRGRPTTQPSPPVTARRPADAVSTTPAVFARRRTAGTPVCGAGPIEGRTLPGSGTTRRATTATIAPDTGRPPIPGRPRAALSRRLPARRCWRTAGGTPGRESGVRVGGRPRFRPLPRSVRRVVPLDGLPPCELLTRGSAIAGWLSLARGSLRPLVNYRPARVGNCWTGQIGPVRDQRRPAAVSFPARLFAVTRHGLGVTVRPRRARLLVEAERLGGAAGGGPVRRAGRRTVCGVTSTGPVRPRRLIAASAPAPPSRVAGIAARRR